MMILHSDPALTRAAQLQHFFEKFKMIIHLMIMLTKIFFLVVFVLVVILL